MYRCISINWNVVEKFIYFSNSTQIVKLMSQQIRIWWHANQLINSKHLQRFPEPSKWSLSLVHWATQSWGRLIWQLSRRQSLTPFTRRVSHKHSLPKKLAVHRVLYPSMLTESWVEGKSVEEKDAQPTERTAALWGLSSKHRFKNLGELHKEWTEAGVKASRATTHRRVKEFGYSCRIPLVKPLLNHRQRQRRLTWAKEKKNWTVAQWSKVLFSDESKFCISFGNKVLESGGRVEKLIAQVAWRPVLSFHSLWWFGCNVICWCWSIVFFENQRHCTRLPRKFGALSCFLLLISFSSRILAPAHTAKSTKSWLNDHGVGVLDVGQQTHQTWTP